MSISFAFADSAQYLARSPSPLGWSAPRSQIVRLRKKSKLSEHSRTRNADSYLDLALMLRRTFLFRLFSRSDGPYNSSHQSSHGLLHLDCQEGGVNITKLEKGKDLNPSLLSSSFSLTPSLSLLVTILFIALLSQNDESTHALYIDLCRPTHLCSTCPRRFRVSVAVLSP